jgi:predicted permease
MTARFLFTCNAVLPIVLTILTGYFLKVLKIFPPEFFKFLNKLSFRCCLPVMLFLNVYRIENLSEVSGYTKIVLFTFAAIMLSFFISVILCALFVKDEKQKGVMVQAAYRSNNAIIGLSMVISLMSGKECFDSAVAVASVLTSIFIPLFNILAVISLTMFIKENGKSAGILTVLKNIAKNPLIIACLTGFIVLIIRHFIPLEINEAGIERPVFTIKENLPFLYRTLEMLGSCATTVALIALGGGFTFSAVAKLKYMITAGTLTRLVIVPVSVLFAARALGFGEVEFPALIALFGTPVAVSSVPMATEMNNDDELAGQLVVWTSIASAFTLFAIIFACAQTGIFTV